MDRNNNFTAVERTKRVLLHQEEMPWQQWGSGGGNGEVGLFGFQFVFLLCHVRSVID